MGCLSGFGYTVIKYRILQWSEVNKRYELLWEGHDLETAERQFNKPYYGDYKRELVKLEEKVIAIRIRGKVKKVAEEDG